MIKKDDIVKFKPKWQDNGDDKIVFRAVDDEYDGRVRVVACAGMNLNPEQIVKVDWLEVSEE